MKGLIIMLPLFHTVNILTRTSSSFNYLIQKKLEENNMLRRKPFPTEGKEGYVYLPKKEYGISKIILWKKKCKEFEYHAMEIRLNPKLLIEEDNYADITYFEEMDIVHKRFNKFIDIFTYNNIPDQDNCIATYNLPHLKDWKTNRIDLAIDVITNKPDKYMKLLQCGDLPKGYSLKPIGEAEGEDPDDKSISFVAESKKKNITFNFYHKGKQLEKWYDNERNIEKSKFKIRFEVQCEKSKIHNMVKKYGLKNNSFGNLTNPEITREVITGYYKKIFRTGDYYSLKEAKKQVREMNLSKKKKVNLIEILELVKQYKSIGRARYIYIEKDIGTKKRFNEYLDLLNDININPVTLPKSFYKDKMENLLKKLELQFVKDEYYIHQPVRMR